MVLGAPDLTIAWNAPLERAAALHLLREHAARAERRVALERSLEDVEVALARHGGPAGASARVDALLGALARAVHAQPAANALVPGNEAAEGVGG